MMPKQTSLQTFHPLKYLQRVNTIQATKPTCNANVRSYEDKQQRSCVAPALNIQ